ncbi:zinc carboxypeptidase-like [Musca domestica]|uniref:Zinc carboxypeptidase-like n=1 Tax=Musca domestica TaxID=7370 RepID=A0ABM3UWP4_MUSDO|nr:zinc carboxypeptidase-like [Musca domestica]
MGVLAYPQLSITENPEEYTKIWIDSGTHAREWITTSTVTFILNRFMDAWQDQPNYIRNKTWYFMPIVNPDGYEHSRKKDRLWRKNRTPNQHTRCKGVDLNRNFNIGWNTQGSSANPCRDTYHGRQPFSEMETQAIGKFLHERKHNLLAFLTFHSYGQMLLYPYGHTAAKYKDASMLQRVGDEVARYIRKTMGKKYQVGSRHKLLYPAGGGADDWACSTLGARYVYTIELRDRGRYGFVLPSAQIIPTALEGYAVVDAVARDI